MRAPEQAYGSTRVVLAVDDVAPDRARTVFVDPYTGAVLGQLTTSGEWLPVRAWVDDLHLDLHLGEVGRVYSELAASWLWVLVGGLALWAARRARAARGQGRWRAIRDAVKPDLSPTCPRSRTLSWHGAVGVWGALGLLGLSATGLTWSHFAGADAVLGDGVGLDGVLATDRAYGITYPLQLTPPEQAGTAWTVAETRKVWPVRHDSVAVDPADGRVVDALRFSDHPLAAKVTQRGADAHVGILLGPANMIALAALALALTVMIVWGYRVWWLRRPTPTWRSAGAAPRRVAWGQVPRSWLVVGGR